MIADLYALLIEATLSISLATAAMLILRRPLRRVFGARVAYAIWLVVPIALATILLPRPMPSNLPIVAPVVMPAFGAFDGQAMQGNPWQTATIVTLWIAGAIALLVAGLLRQRRFERALGATLVREDGCLQASSDAVGPVVVGCWRGRIVVPADFDQRYTPGERELILVHERVHLARHDLAVNLGALVLRCLQWFSPLVHVAASRFRFDQELAADALVLAQRPQERRPYADAMLKTQLAANAFPLGCHWQSANPLKERIAMLKRPIPGIARVALGVAVSAALSLTLGYAAWAAQPLPLDDVANPPTYARLTPPRYPSAAIDKREQGGVMLSVLVAADGSPQQVEVDGSSGSAELDAAAVAAVRKWRFNPANDGYKNVSAWVHVPINFSLTDQPSEDAPAAPTPGALEEIYIKGE
jgi:TonB family protein